MTTNKDYAELLITGIALKELHGNLKQIVMPQNHKTLADLRKAAILAEKTVLSTSAKAASASVRADDITKRVLDAVTDKLLEVLALGEDRRVEVEDNYVDFNSTMASGIHITMPQFHGNSGENAKVGWHCSTTLQMHITSMKIRRGKLCPSTLKTMPWPGIMPNHQKPKVI